VESPSKITVKQIKFIDSTGWKNLRNY
jgi:hypothetical protein